MQVFPSHRHLNPENCPPKVPLPLRNQKVGADRRIASSCLREQKRGCRPYSILAKHQRQRRAAHAFTATRPSAAHISSAPRRCRCCRWRGAKGPSRRDCAGPSQGCRRFFICPPIGSPHPTGQHRIVVRSEGVAAAHWAFPRRVPDDFSGLPASSLSMRLSQKRRGFRPFLLCLIGHRHREGEQRLLQTASFRMPLGRSL